METRTCATCRYWEPAECSTLNEEGVEILPTGLCRHQGPSTWRETFSTDWCGWQEPPRENNLEPPLEFNAQCARLKHHWVWKFGDDMGLHCCNCFIPGSRHNGESG